jgi:hypothetical protein
MAQGVAARLAADGMVSLMTHRLGDRRQYGRYAKTLGQAVHYDAHLLMLYQAEPGFRFDGLGSSWLVRIGGYQERAALYPRRGFIEEMESRKQRTRDLRRLLDAIERLRDYDPHLHHVVFSLCVAGSVKLIPGRGIRHTGEVWTRLLKGVYGGDERRLWRHMVAGWEVVAVLAVEPAILKAAQEAGAADQRAVAWARERGLID